jgi:hypothetical protein
MDESGVHHGAAFKQETFVLRNGPALPPIASKPLSLNC